MASTLGRMVEVDWGSQIASYFAMVRIKIVVKGPTQIPTERLMEMRKKLFQISFKIEGDVIQQDDGQDGDDDGIMERRTKQREQVRTRMEWIQTGQHQRWTTKVKKMMTIAVRRLINIEGTRQDSSWLVNSGWKQCSQQFITRGIEQLQQLQYTMENGAGSSEKEGLIEEEGENVKVA